MQGTFVTKGQDLHTPAPLPSQEGAIYHTVRNDNQLRRTLLRYHLETVPPNTFLTCDQCRVWNHTCSKHAPTCVLCAQSGKTCTWTQKNKQQRKGSNPNFLSQEDQEIQRIAGLAPPCDPGPLLVNQRRKGERGYEREQIRRIAAKKRQHDPETILN